MLAGRAHGPQAMTHGEPSISVCLLGLKAPANTTGVQSSDERDKGGRT